MSKGMKQKIGLVCAFMNDPEILILDEPTSGLDPLMQNKFVDLILEEKKKGKTVLMSSHIFEEIEKTCDRTAIIKEGKLIAVENMKELKSNKKKIYEIVFASEEMTKNFLKEKLLVQLMDLEEQLIWVSNEETLEQKKIKKVIEKQYRKILKKLKKLNEIE